MICNFSCFNRQSFGPNLIHWSEFPFREPGAIIALCSGTTSSILTTVHIKVEKVLHLFDRNFHTTYEVSSSWRAFFNVVSPVGLIHRMDTKTKKTVGDKTTVTTKSPEIDTMKLRPNNGMEPRKTKKRQNVRLEPKLTKSFDFVVWLVTVSLEKKHLLFMHL